MRDGWPLCRHGRRAWLGFTPNVRQRYNAHGVQEHRVGLVRHSFRAIRDGVDDLIAGLPEYRTRVARIQNRAVFEIPEILERLLHPGNTLKQALAGYGLER